MQWFSAGVSRLVGVDALEDACALADLDEMPVGVVPPPGFMMIQLPALFTTAGFRNMVKAAGAPMSHLVGLALTNGVDF